MLCLLTGCGTVKGIFGKQSQSVSKQAVKIEQVQSSLNILNKETLKQIGTLSYGIDRSIKSTGVTNKLYNVWQLNDRILSLTPYPSLDEKKKMDDIVFSLGKDKDALKEKDKEISALQHNLVELTKEKDEEIRNALALSVNVAGKADTYNSQLQEYQGWFGLKAVLKGLGTFVKSSLWFLVVGGILYLLLRAFAAANPIVGAVFQVFNVIGGVLVRIIQSLAPKAAEAAGHVSGVYRDVLTKVVDAVESHASPSVKTQLSVKMDASEKDVIRKVKKDLLY